jgi:hypothetical protein
MDVLNLRAVLNCVLLCIFVLGIARSTPVYAGPYDLSDETDPEKRSDTAEMIAAKKRLCHSTDEYIKTLKYLRETKDFGFREDAARKIAEIVSGGCDGAANRFAQILILLKTVGMSERRTLEMALEFAKASPDVQKNFLEIFTKAFLTEFFDYEFPKAMNLAFELSRDYKGDPARARADFIALVRFCKNSKSLDLPMSFCADYSIEMAKLSQFYKHGVSTVFLELFKDLRNRKEFSLDVKTALEISHGILKNGPLAPQNFMKAFDYATKEFEYDKKKALEFAAKMANHSFVGDEPPVMQFVPQAAPPPMPTPQALKPGGGG